jgi:large subunit ribosomal protein L15
MNVEEMSICYKRDYLISNNDIVFIEVSISLQQTPHTKNNMLNIARKFIITHHHHHQFIRSNVHPLATAAVQHHQSYTTNSHNEKLKQQRIEKYNTFIRNENLNVQDIKLNTLKYVPGSKPTKKRLGRGQGSGLGKTSGRGVKGQTSRTGHNIPKGFEGGQTPIYRKVPKFGFNNKKFALDYHPISLERIQYLVDTGRIESNGTITMKTLKDAGVIHNVKFPGVKLLSKGAENFKSKIDIEVPRASKSAIQLIEQNGGSIRCIYYNKKSLLMLLKGYPREEVIQSMAIPPPKLYKYYLREDVRGYLSQAVSTNRFDLVPDHEEEEERKRGDKYATTKKSAASKTSTAGKASKSNK